MLKAPMTRQKFWLNMLCLVLAKILMFALFKFMPVSAVLVFGWLLYLAIIASLRLLEAKIPFTWGLVLVGLIVVNPSIYTNAIFFHGLLMTWFQLTPFRQVQNFVPFVAVLSILAIGLIPDRVASRP